MLLKVRGVRLRGTVVRLLFDMRQNILEVVIAILELALQVVLKVMVVVGLVLKGSLVAVHVRLLRLHLAFLRLIVRRHDGRQALGQLRGELELLRADRRAGLVLVRGGVLLGILSIVLLVHKLVLHALLQSLGGMIVGAAGSAVGRGRVALLHHHVLRLAIIPLHIHDGLGSLRNHKAVPRARVGVYWGVSGAGN